MPTCNCTKKNSFTHPSSCILPLFSQSASQLLLPRKLWKSVSTISFRKYKQKVVLLVIYLLNYDSPTSTFFMLNIAFDVVLSRVFSNKLEFFVSCNIKHYKNILLFALCFDMYFSIKIWLFSIMMIIIFYFDICDKPHLMCLITSFW